MAALVAGPGVKLSEEWAIINPKIAADSGPLAIEIISLYKKNRSTRTGRCRDEDARIAWSGGLHLMIEVDLQIYFSPNFIHGYKTTLSSVFNIDLDQCYTKEFRA